MITRPITYLIKKSKKKSIPSLVTQTWTINIKSHRPIRLIVLAWNRVPSNSMLKKEKKKNKLGIIITIKQRCDVIGWDAIWLALSPYKVGGASQRLIADSAGRVYIKIFSIFILIQYSYIKSWGVNTVVTSLWAWLNYRCYFLRWWWLMGCGLK